MSFGPSKQAQRSILGRFDWATLRIFVPLAILLLVALSRFYTYETAIALNRQEVLADMLRSQRVLALHLQATIEDGLHEGEWDDVRKSLSILNATQEVQAAILLDAHGKILAANQPAWVGKDAADVHLGVPLPGAATGRTWLSADNRWVLSAYPVGPVSTPGGNPVRTVAGTLFIASDPSSLLAERNRDADDSMRRTNWVVLVLAVLAWALIHFLVSRRVGKLMGAIERFDKGEVEVASGVSGGDEIGRLGRAFDKMVRTQMRCALNTRKLSQAVEQSAASVIITDRRGIIEFVNAAFTAITGYSEEEAIGQSTRVLSAGETDPEQYRDLWDTISSGKTWRGEMLNRRKNGELYWDSVVISPVHDENGEITHFVAIQEDITARKDVEQKLLMNMHILNSITEGVAVTDAEQKFRYVNPAFTAITGYTPEEVLGKSPKLLSSGLMERTFYGTMWQGIGSTGHWQGEIIDRRKNGESYPEWLSISALKDERGRVTSYVSVFIDISERKAAEKRMAHMAQHDFLTGLPNRMLLLDRLGQAINRAERDGYKVAVMFLDLDRFKNINDTLGHTVGDKLLQEVASRIARVSRAGDTICRLGGDEFVVMLPGVESTAAVSVIAQKLLESIAGSCVIDGNEIEVTTSVGVSVYPDDGRDAGSLLKHADSAMYHAKESGRNNYRFFTSEMNQRVLERMAIETKLRRALTRREFVLHYQPQVNLHTGQVVGVEALLRWHDPEVGILPPGHFIQIAEENGLIIPIGEWVLREACEQKAKWLKLGLPDIVMSVNLSVVQLRQKNLAETIVSILNAHGLRPSGLELEITESAVMRDAEASITVLHSLKNMGVKLAMDDFGTGYSSLSYLKRFPIDRLKIDQSFVRDIPQDQDDAAIVSTIISMARNLKLQVIAEGVESDRQLAFLNQHGCAEGQGYYFGSPMPDAEIVAFIRKRL